MTQLVVLFAGLALLVVGLGMLSVPAALATAGASLACFALFWDFGGGDGRT